MVRRPADAPLPHKAEPVPGHLAHPLGVEPVRRPESGHDHPDRGDLAEGVNQGDLARLAFDLTVLDQPADGAVQRLVHRAGGPSGLGHALEQVDHQGGGIDAGYIAGPDNNLHYALVTSSSLANSACYDALTLDPVAPARRAISASTEEPPPDESTVKWLPPMGSSWEAMWQ